MHHTISNLRKVLGGKHSIRRSGAQYALNIPPGSWIDVDRFEQLCRRGLALLTHENLEAAHTVYAAAEQLYRGDLFEGMPVENLDYDLEDWCLSRRIWLHSMAAKLNYDMSKVLRRTGQWIVPPANGLEVRIINGYVYMAMVPVPPEQIKARIPHFMERAGHYFAN